MSVYRKTSKGSTNNRGWAIPAIRSWAIRREGKTVQVNRAKEKRLFNKSITKENNG